MEPGRAEGRIRSSSARGAPPACATRTTSRAAPCSEVPPVPAISSSCGQRIRERAKEKSKHRVAERSAALSDPSAATSLLTPTPPPPSEIRRIPSAFSVTRVRFEPIRAQEPPRTLFKKNLPSVTRITPTQRRCAYSMHVNRSLRSYRHGPHTSGEPSRRSQRSVSGDNFSLSGLRGGAGLIRSAPRSYSRSPNGCRSRRAR